jgi:hypothetical protein
MARTNRAPVPDASAELVEALASERARGAELQERIDARRLREAEALEGLRRRVQAVEGRAEDLERRRDEALAELPHLREAVARLEGGLFGWRHTWVRLGVPVVSAMALFGSIVAVAFPHGCASLGLGSALGSVAALGVWLVGRGRR